MISSQDTEVFQVDVGVGVRHDLMASKIPVAQTCSSESSGLGEWTRTDLIDPDEAKNWQRLVLQPDNTTAASINTGVGERIEMVVYRPTAKEQLMPIVHYAYRQACVC